MNVIVQMKFEFVRKFFFKLWLQLFLTIGMIHFICKIVHENGLLKYLQRIRKHNLYDVQHIGFVLFYGTSTIVGYLISNPFLYI